MYFLAEERMSMSNLLPSSARVSFSAEEFLVPNSQIPIPMLTSKRIRVLVDVRYNVNLISSRYLYQLFAY